MKKKLVYEVIQWIEIKDEEEDNKVIDYQKDCDYYDTYAEAHMRLEELQDQIGQVICGWGDGSVGVLAGVDMYDEPVEEEFYD